MNKITLKELYLQSYHDTSGISNYPLFKLLCEENHFIFYDLMDTLNNSMYDYPLLKAFLSKITAYNQYSGLFPPQNVECATVLDLLLLQTYGNRKCNILIDEFRYNFMPFNSQESDYSLFSLELSFLLINRFADRWEKYISELALAYNPIHNYDMNEHEEVNTDITVDGDDTHSLQGFNSTSFKPESQNKQNHNTTGEAKDNFRDLHRNGNIGVTTSQQMLESEIKLRDENIVVERIILDVANFITVGVYDD